MMDRRTLLAGMTATAAAAPTAVQAFRGPEPSQPEAPDWWRRITEVIEQLESPEGWEMSAAAAAKAHAAGEMRKALGMDVPYNRERDEYDRIAECYRERQRDTWPNFGEAA